jgi:hypothetical protein
VRERSAGCRGPSSVNCSWTAGSAGCRPSFQRYFKQNYEPAVFDVRLSFAEKIEKRRVQPKVSLQLVYERAVAVVAGGDFGEHGVIT